MKLGKITLTDSQAATVKELSSGNILVAGVGSGKTYTSIAWASQYLPERELIVITTAMNRNKGAWHESIEACGITDYTVDSWNNIHKYQHKETCVFIFDEQRVVGYGKWSRSVINISRKDNVWILASATPGDTWMEYITVFIANGFYKNKTEFLYNHVEWMPHVKFPMVKQYHSIELLEKYRDSIIVTMVVDRHTKRHKHYTYCQYDVMDYKTVGETLINPYTEYPIQSASELSQTLRRIVNESEDRQNKALEMMRSIDKLIIFYNYNYELELLRELAKLTGKHLYEYNGHKHEFVGKEKQWIYLVQYTAGAEGWNCITTDSILFYSVNHSYKKMEQAMGRIDRMNTPYTSLHYYFMTSKATIDMATLRAINNKKEFNESLWVRKRFNLDKLEQRS